MYPKLIVHVTLIQNGLTSAIEILNNLQTVRHITHQGISDILADAFNVMRWKIYQTFHSTFRWQFFYWGFGWTDERCFKTCWCHRPLSLSQLLSMWVWQIQSYKLEGTSVTKKGKISYIIRDFHEEVRKVRTKQKIHV